MTGQQVREVVGLTTRQLAAARVAGAAIQTVGGTAVLLEPRGRRDPHPWVDAAGNRYPGGKCKAVYEEEKPRALTAREMREVAERTGIDWEQILGRAG